MAFVPGDKKIKSAAMRNNILPWLFIVFLIGSCNSKTNQTDMNNEKLIKQYFDYNT